MGQNGLFALGVNSVVRPWGRLWPFSQTTQCLWVNDSGDSWNSCNRGYHKTSGYFVCCFLLSPTPLKRWPGPSGLNEQASWVGRDDDVPMSGAHRQRNRWVCQANVSDFSQGQSALFASSRTEITMVPTAGSLPCPTQYCSSRERGLCFQRLSLALSALYPAPARISDESCTLALSNFIQEIWLYGWFKSIAALKQGSEQII